MNEQNKKNELIISSTSLVPVTERLTDPIPEISDSALSVKQTDHQDLRATELPSEASEAPSETFDSEGSEKQSDNFVHESSGSQSDDFPYTPAEQSDDLTYQTSDPQPAASDSELQESDTPSRFGKLRQIFVLPGFNRSQNMKPPRGHLTREQRRRLFRRIFLSVGAAILTLILLTGVSVCYLILTAPDLDTITVSPTESATYIYDQQGNPLRKLTLSTSNRDIVSLDEVPAALQHAVIAIEDERFYEHGGIDLHGIARAFWNGIRSGGFSEGASTITQQLIKNSVFTDWTQEDSFFDRFSRKVREQYLAVRLDGSMSKDEILENYLNIINLGSGCYGVQSASRRYFGKPVSDLTLSEASVLAAIPQNPAGLNPITYPEKNNRRRTIVLNYMEEQGYITPEEHTAALQDNVYDRIREYNASYEDEASVYSYYEDALIEQVIEVLTEEKGYTYDQAHRAVYSGGLRIISAQNQEIQTICDQEFANSANFPAGTHYGIDYALSISDADGIVTHFGSDHLRKFVRQNYDSAFDLMCLDPDTAQKYADAFRTSVIASYQDGAPEILAERLTLSPQPQASVVILDQNTGYVQAIVGGRGEKTGSLTLNRATNTTRQPGSTFKILTAYAPALDLFGKTLATIYDNEPYEYYDGTPVSNWDLNDYSGPTTIREAITRSINVVAVKCITEISPQLGFEYAQKFGISTLHERYEEDGNYSSDLVQPLALGGITQGVTNLELCSAYAAIADGGIYRKPKFFVKVLDRYGNIVIDNTTSEDDSSETAADASLRSNQSGSSAEAAVSASPNITTENQKSGDLRILKPSTAYLLTDAMRSVVTAEDGTAYGSISAGNIPVAGKTGTTSNYKDIWFVGYTPYYTCSVWGGYDNNENLPDGSTYHTYNKILWTSIMSRIHAALPAAEFECPENIIHVTLCAESRLPAVAGGCPHTYEEVFEEGTEPTGECPLHEPIPETEPIIIYQDILEQILPETESETEPESESIPDTETESEPRPGSSIENESNPANESENISNPENGPEDASEPGNSTSASGTENNSVPDSGTENSFTPGNGTENSSVPGNETESKSIPGNDTAGDSGSGQPQTTSLDDMIERLNLYRLP